MDSMVAHYTAAKRKRHDDPYTPGNVAGKRPDRAVLVYCKRIRELYPDLPLIIGGIEGSLRRFAHYDYWDDIVRPSILWESNADLLVYGMGERQISEIAKRLRQGEKVEDLRIFEVRFIKFLPTSDYPKITFPFLLLKRWSVIKEPMPR